MGRRKPKTREALVSHPRYGSESIPSGLTIPEREIRSAHWRYAGGFIYPASVLVADATKQNYSTYPRQYYVDIVKTCRECGKRFIFFAREQRYWFETLRFYVDADCVYCPVCRRANQMTRRRLRRYSDLVARSKPSRKDLMFLVDDGVYLLECGVLRDLDRLGRLKNEAQRRIGEYPGAALLAQAIARARAAKEASVEQA